MQSFERQPETYALTDGLFFDGERLVHNSCLLIQGDRIMDLAPQSELPKGVPAFSLKGAVASPGFVDLQINGCGGVMFNDAVTLETLERMRAVNIQSGCTSFLPTLISAPDEDMLAAMRAVALFREKHGPCGVIGLHLEGPYINPARKGIHNEKHIRRLDGKMRDALLDYARTTPLMLTLAPECVDPADVRALAQAGVCVSIGHSAATYEEAKKAVQAGARAVTHLFNAMSQWQSRAPGVAGAALEAEDLHCGLIVDGLHAHFASIALAKRLKGERCFLTSDATAAAGSDIASFDFCGQTVYVKDGKCVNADGTLGGAWF